MNRRIARTTRLIMSADQSYVGSVIVALDANHIPHVDLPGGTPWTPQTAVMVREIDIRRAKEAIQDLQRTTSSYSNQPREVVWFGRVLIALLLAIVAIGTVRAVAQLF